MSPKYPDIPMFQGINAPSRIEVDLHDLEADGEIPAGLNGAYHCMLHDFGVTEDYAVFPIIPVCRVGIEALQAGKPHYEV